MTRAILGVDIGGTFTDLCLLDIDNDCICVAKVPSIPANPALALSPGIRALMETYPGSVKDIAAFSHGTTVATNALLQRKGGKTALFTTEGFKDLLVIGRQKRPRLYDLYPKKPPPLVAEDDRIEVSERMSHKGEVITPLDMEEVARAVRALSGKGFDAVAVCFLFSYTNPEHEQRVRDKVEELLPDAFVCASSDVHPEFREFERLSTTVVNAYLGPCMSGYMDSLVQEATAAGIQAPPRVIQSNSGLMSIAEARSRPVHTLLSGPCAGVIGAQYGAKLAGIGNIVTFDMGGTSTDVSLVENGNLRFHTDTEIDHIPIQVPMVDVHTIGAGGGSIAWIDEGGLLKVGPQSQGADPGPACYAKGGEEPTVTDANVLLGRLPKGNLLDGRMTTDGGLSEKVIREKIAGRIGKDPVGAALGILRIVESNMMLTIRLISVQRGFHLQDFSLMAYGGAGPLHAVAMARELGIGEVVVPPSPGILCALGLLVADIRTTFVQTRKIRTENARPEVVDGMFAELEKRAEEWLDGEKVEKSRRRIERSVDMRYLRQNYELTVSAPEGGWTEEFRRTLDARFHELHDKTYGHADETARTELVNFRVTAIGQRDSVPLPHEAERASGAPEPGAYREVCFSEEEGFISCPVYRRDALRPGHEFAGPAVVEQMDATTVVDAGAAARVDSYFNLIITLK